MVAAPTPSRVDWVTATSMRTTIQPVSVSAPEHFSPEMPTAMAVGPVGLEPTTSGLKARSGGVGRRSWQSLSAVDLREQLP